jgi:protocatechuate 3,4-dioxygenase beta subunit
MRHLQTAMYFDPPAPPLENGERLVAKKEGANRYRFDIRLRGERETPFFDD